jgi:GntR family transcriptional regulator, transcriptional repressor for pyruvate dehydrogenase complex
MTIAEAAQRPPKAALLVAQRIVRDALRDNLQPGDLLLPERTMLEKYQTGRGTLREALRLLEFQGVLALKPGPRGGPVLQVPDSSHLASTVVLLMQLHKAPLRTIVQVRTALEPMVCGLAAGRIDEESLEALRVTNTQMRAELDDQRSFLEADRRFHDILTWSSGNALLGYLVDSLLRIVDGTVLGLDYPNVRRAAVLKAHEAILTALESRDSTASEARMREHAQDDERYAERKFPQLLEETITWDSRFHS